MNTIILILYNIILVLLLPLYIISSIFRRKFHAGFWKRFGYVPPELLRDKRPKIWIHSCSVGETMTIKPFFERLYWLYPQHAFIISTVTKTGNKVALNVADGRAYVMYLPVDIWFAVRAVVRAVRPQAFILTETEFWPSLITVLKKAGSKIAVINGRISDKSFKGYKRFSPFFKRILKNIDVFCMQSVADRDRLNLIGVEKEKISVIGNMKFDSLSGASIDKDKLKYFSALFAHLKDAAFVVAGSTHPGEERRIIKMYKDIKRDYPHLRFLIAPRHPERAGEVLNLCKQEGESAVFVSEAKKQFDDSGIFSLDDGIFILDSVGELIYIYECADIVLIGGTLAACGGHNPIEPAYFTKPVIVGPHMENFRDISELFLCADGIVQAEGIRGVEEVIRKMLDDRAFAGKVAQAGRRVVLNNMGSSDRTVEIVKRLLA